MTVNAWLDVWLKDYQGHTTGRTVMTYSSALDNYVRPVIGRVLMAKLKTMHIMRVLSGMQGRNLSPTTQRQTCNIMKNAMKTAILAGVIKTDPTNGVKVPKWNAKPFKIIDRQQIQAFVAAAQDTPFPNELLLMLYTGLRVGELRGLMWQDADLDGAKLKVERQLYAHAHSTGFGFPKYGEVRTIELIPEAVAVLRRQRVRQAEQQLAAGANWKDTDISRDLIFRQGMGQPHTNSSLARAVKSAGEAIGVSDLHPHELRHSYAVAAIRSGMDIKTVQHNMGHKSASVTLDTYANYTTDAGKIGAIKLSDYFKNST